jgi:transcriptional regulator with XRE-family HTH domain
MIELQKEPTETSSMFNIALKTIRQFHKLSKDKLASRLKVSSIYLSELESGKREPSVDDLQRYADVFKIPLSSLFVFSETLAGQHNISTVQKFISKKCLVFWHGFLVSQALMLNNKCLT